MSNIKFYLKLIFMFWFGDRKDAGNIETEMDVSICPTSNIFGYESFFDHGGRIGKM